MATRPGLTRGLTQTLAEGLVDAPPDRGAVERNEEPDEEQAEPLHDRALRRQTTTELNREAFETNQRHLAAQILARVVCCTVCLSAATFALLLATVFIYCKGYDVYSRSGNKKCNVPLKVWLAIVLTVLPLRVLLAIVYRCMRVRQNPTEDDSLAAKAISFVLRGWNLIGNPVLICCGFYWFCHSSSKTCDPELYDFVKLFLIYQVLMAVGGILIFFGATSFILWAHSQNLFDTGPGPHAAAQPGTIEKMETVKYDPSLFSRQPGDEQEPPECCVCQIPFDDDAEIKRTPCQHYFHKECLGNWLGKYARSCPLCRNDLEDAVGAT